MKDSPSPLVKYAAAAVVLILFAAISSWIVDGQGRAYRERIAVKAKENPVPEPEVISDPDLGRVDPTRSKDPQEHKPAPDPSPDSSKESAPLVAQVSPPPKPPEQQAPPPKPIDPFWDESDQRKTYDFDRFTAEDERELGRTLHRMVLHDHPEIVDGPLPRRLEEAAKPYLAARVRKDVEYKFFVLDCPRMNVFSHPGGYVYVCKGLFDWIAEDEDYALGFILGHEIAHVDLAHAITCLKDPEVKKFKFGAGLLFFALAIPGGYFPEQDQAADKWAAEQMLKTGRTRYETLAFLRRLEDYSRTHGFENRRKYPNDTPIVPVLDNHIRAHPIPRTRIEEMKTLIDRLQKT